MSDISTKKTKSVKSNAVINIVRQVSNIILPLVTYPYVLRVLGATNIGKYSFGDSIVSMAMVFAALGMQTYAVREGARIRNDKGEITRFSSELFTISLFSMALTVLITVGLTLTVPRFGKDSAVIYILCMNIVFSILGRDWINNIYEDFLYITVRYIVFQLLAMGLIFAFVHEPDDYLKYVFFTVVGNSGGCIVNIFYTLKYAPIKITTRLNLKKHIKPLLYLFGVALTIKIYVQSDITILGFFVDDKNVGVYAIASKVYVLVKALLNAAITVAIPRLSFYLGNSKEKEYYDLLGKLKSALYTMVFPCVVGLFMEAENVLRLIGGEEYLSGTNTLRILCIALGLAVFACYYTQAILVINNKENVFFWATAVSAVINIVLNLVVIPFFGIEGAAATTVISELVVMIICWNSSKDLIRDKGSVSEIIKVAMGCVGICACCLLVERICSNYILQLMTAIPMSVCLYLVIEIVLSNNLIKENVVSLKNRFLRKDLG